MENEPNDLLLTILYAGKDLYEEIHRNLFVSECKIAARLQNDGEQFINDLLIGCRHLQRNREIMDGVYDIVGEFQRLMHDWKNVFKCLRNVMFIIHVPNQRLKDVVDRSF